jgi:hypothetical protein
LVLPAFAIAGYHGVVVFLLLLSSAACALTWWLAWRVTGSASAAWFGWAAVALSPPYLLESFTVYPDGPAAAIVIVGFWALLRADWEREQGKASALPWVLYGTALAALPWMHTRFAVLAATLGGLILLRLARGPNPAAKAIAFLVVPALSALSWLAFFLAIYGTPDPSAPYAGQLQSSFSFLLNGVGGLFFDQGFGLILTAPVLLVAFAEFRRTPRLALEWTIVAVPYLLAVTTFAMWWAGWSGPARFFVPLILPLAIPAAAAWRSAQDRGVRTSLAAALAVTCWLSAVLVGGGGGRLAYHTRNEGGMTAAPWIEWASPSLDIPAALPAFVPLPTGTALVARETAARNGFLLLIPWVVCLGGATFLLRSIVHRLPPGRASLGAAATIVYALAVSVALAAIWRGHGLTAVNSVTAQTNLLRRLAHERVLAIDLSDRRRLSRDDVVMRVRIDLPNRRIERGGRPNQPIAAIAQVPAGEYLIETERLGGDGWVMAGVGLDQFALVTQPASTFDAGVRLRLPVDVRTLVVRADDEARQQIVRVRMRPLHLATGSERLTRDVAYHAVRYGTTSVFFLDDRAYPEPSAFWVGGGRETAVVISPDHASPSLPLLLRNAPIANVVTLSSGGWQEELMLEPGDERRVDVPVQGDAVLVRLRTKTGFRPSDADARNRDTRDLGVYVRVPGP